MESVQVSECSGVQVVCRLLKISLLKIHAVELTHLIDQSPNILIYTVYHPVFPTEVRDKLCIWIGYILYLSR
jgi:hypothetical protein